VNKKTSDNISLTRKIKNVKKYSYPLNQDSINSFGFYEYSDFDIVYPNSICIDSSYCYIVDPFYNRLKKINLNNGIIESSPKLPDSIGKIYDCAVFINNIIATSSNGSLVVFNNKKLSDFSNERLSRGYGLITNADDFICEIYFPSDNLSVFTINSNTEVVSVVNKRLDLKDKVHGKQLIIKQDSIITNVFKVFRDNIGNKLSDLGGNKVDFNSETCVYFNIEKDSLSLYVLSLEQ
jgi:hypothetical protein